MTFKLLKFLNSQIDIKILSKIIINFILIIIYTLAEILFLSTIYILINKNIESNSIGNFLNYISNFFIVNLDLSVVQINFIILIIFLILKNIFFLAQQFYYMKFIYNLTTYKSKMLLNNYLNKSYSNFIKKDVSVYFKEILKDVENVFSGIFGLIISIVGEFFFVISIIFYLIFVIKINITFSSILILVIAASFIRFLFKYTYKFGTLRASSEIKLFKYLTDTLNMFKELKISKKNNFFLDHYEYYLVKYFNSKIGSGVINLSPKFLFEITAIIFLFLLFKSSNLNFDDFILEYSILAFAILRIIPSVARIASYIGNIIYNLKSFHFIGKDLIKIPKLNKANSLNTKISTIGLKNIHLTYLSKKTKNKKKIFDNLSLNFKAGNIYGIYGPSGSGKTSLINILSGLIFPNNGKIYFNNKNINFKNITQYYKVGLLPQSPIILDESIIFNISLNKEVSDEEIKQIKKLMELFNLKKFINKSFLYGNQSITSSAKNMSGGEKQRLAFIRSIYSSPNLILLDEPTSSLDKNNEKLVLNYLKKIKKNKIIIVSTHNQKIMNFFDKIINLN